VRVYSVLLQDVGGGVGSRICRLKDQFRSAAYSLLYCLLLCRFVTIIAVGLFCCCEAVDGCGEIKLKWMVEWTELNWFRIEPGGGLLSTR
jgi:hypothetical protein